MIAALDSAPLALSDDELGQVTGGIVNFSYVNGSGQNVSVGNNRWALANISIVRGNNNRVEVGTNSGAWFNYSSVRGDNNNVAVGNTVQGSN